MLNKNGDKISGLPVLGILLMLAGCFHSSRAQEIKVPFLEELFGAKKEEPPPKKTRSYQEGLEILGREIPFDAKKARYGRFEPAKALREVFQYRRTQIENLSGNGWLTEIDGQTVFWLDAIHPLFVEPDKTTPENPNALTGKFVAVDWRKDLPKIEAEIAQKQPEELLYTGTSSSLVVSAAILDAQGESESANRLVALALRKSAHERGNQAKIVCASAINAIAEARYSLAVDRGKELDLAALRVALADILKRYEGCYYYAVPARLLENNIAATLDSKQKPSPFVTWKYSQSDEELLDTVSGTFWLSWNPDSLDKYKDSPIAMLVKRGVEAMPELIAMLGDNRVTTLIRGEVNSGSGEYSRRRSGGPTYYDIRGLTKAPSGMDLRERVNRFSPCPMTVKEIAVAILASIFASPSDSYRRGVDESALAEKAAAFYARYKGLAGSHLAEAIVDSNDSSMKVAMLGSLAGSDPKFFAPLLLRYVQKDPPTEWMLQFVMQLSRQPEGGPIVEAFLNKAKDGKALAQAISDGAGQQDNPDYAKHVVAQIDRLNLASKPATPNIVMEQILRNELDFDVLQTALTKVDPESLAKSYLAHMSVDASPKQIETLLQYLVRAKVIGGSEESEEVEAQKLDVFLKALLADRKTWEAIFQDKRRGEWGVLGETAVSTVYGLGTEEYSYGRSLPAFGGDKLVQWMRKELEKFWTNNTPLAAIPDGKNLDDSALDQLATEALAAPDLGEWIRNLPFEQAVAVTRAADKNPELTKRLKEIATKIGQVEILAPPSPIVDKIRALRGKEFTMDLILEVLEANLESDLSLIVTRPEIPSPVTILVIKRDSNPEEPTERVLMYAGFNPGMEELRMEPAYFGSYPDLIEFFKETEPTIRQLLEPEIGPESSGLGFFWMRYGPEITQY